MTSPDPTSLLEGTTPGEWPNFKPPAQYPNAPPDWIDPRLPPFDLVWQIAREHGYAIGLHGSMMRDCDLIAAAWVEDAAEPQCLVDALCRALNARQVGATEKKPLGRMALTLQIDGWFKPIDLSFASAPALARRVRELEERERALLDWGLEMSGSYQLALHGLGASAKTIADDKMLNKFRDLLSPTPETEET